MAVMGYKLQERVGDGEKKPGISVNAGSDSSAMVLMRLFGQD